MSDFELEGIYRLSLTKIRDNHPDDDHPDDDHPDDDHPDDVCDDYHPDDDHPDDDHPDDIHSDDVDDVGDDEGIEIENTLEETEYFPELSAFKVDEVAGTITFPYYFDEDYYKNKYNDFIKGEFCVVPFCNINILKRQRENSYKATVWYYYLERFTIRSFFVDIETKKLLYTNYLQIYQDFMNKDICLFVKGDLCSPKDIYSTCIFSSVDDAIRIIKMSKRCEGETILFCREVNENILNRRGHELRCFIYHRNMTAVSCSSMNKKKLTPEIKNAVMEFWHEMKNIFPYNDAVMDIFIDNKNNCILIEINCFGADSFTSAGLFNWRDDYFILHNTNVVEVEFRTGSYLNLI